jgi:hypothetical protein
MAGLEQASGLSKNVSEQAKKDLGDSPLSEQAVVSQVFAAAEESDGRKV